MAIPKITGEYINKAFDYIDEHGVPPYNQSVTYNVVSPSGKKYPPKYVIAVANHLENGADISTDNYNAVEAKNYFTSRGYTVETKQEKYTLTITADNIMSTDDRFTMDDLSLGDNYKPLDVYFHRADGEIIRRNYAKGERRSSNQTLTRLTCQIFERSIAALSVEEKENFPIVQYRKDDRVIRGIFSSVEDFKKYRNSIEYAIYEYDNGRQFVIYSWNIFSTIIFARECLRRFGNAGDKFILVYREKDDKDVSLPENTEAQGNEVTGADRSKQSEEYLNPYSEVVLESHNVIFHGAPGTGKSYLAKQIAADIVSNGYVDDFTQLSDEQQKQVQFVQFHPGYDYSDFVEGLRPKTNSDGTIGFELKDGIFKSFADQARKNYIDSQKPMEVVEREEIAQGILDDFFSNVELGMQQFETVSGSKFIIRDISERHIYISIPANEKSDSITLNLDKLKKMLESEQRFEKVKDLMDFFGYKVHTQADSYYFSLYKEIKEKNLYRINITAKPEEQKKYVFIIDEINRGEVSKIFGELFFSIDPGYRGESGSVMTQYSNLHDDPDEKFYIPENVYIIGTMNDIDRSVDSFDFAMRRRFRFIELKANERLEMLANLLNDNIRNEAIGRMISLNAEIAKVEDLNESYQIGAAYFLKLEDIGCDFSKLWTDYLEPLLKEYIRGMYDEDGIMHKLKKAYGHTDILGDTADDSI